MIIGCDDKSSSSITKISDSSNDYGALIFTDTFNRKGIIVGSINETKPISSVSVTVNDFPIEMNYEASFAGYLGMFYALEGETIDIAVSINGKEMINTDIELIYDLDEFECTDSFHLNSTLPFRWVRVNDVNQQYFETEKTWTVIGAEASEYQNKCTLLKKGQRTYKNNISWMGSGENEYISIDFTIHSMNYKKKNGLILASFEVMTVSFNNFRGITQSEHSQESRFTNFKKIINFME